MMKNILELVCCTLCIFLTAQIATGASGAKIVKMSGEVKVRKGMDEKWGGARIGMLLEDIDTILTTEASEVELKLETGETFRLASNAIVDIGDLRKITERELFLFLMAQKMDKIKPREEKAKLRITNVSVTRGENKAGISGENKAAEQNPVWLREMNGAKAMYSQEFYRNAIMKLRKILQKNTNLETCSEVFFYLAKSFEEIDEPGRALDAYRLVIANAENDACASEPVDDMVTEASKAIKSLRE